MNWEDQRGFLDNKLLAFIIYLINTFDSTESGNTHGTPLSICTGMEEQHWASRMNLRKLSFDRLTYVGIRDIDEFEGQTIRENNIRCLDVPNVIDYIKKV